MYSFEALLADLSAQFVNLPAVQVDDAITVLKLHYGQFWVYPGTNFTSAFNPNPSGWSQTYVWTSDANSNGRWDPGEEGRLIAVSGGSPSTRLDPSIENTYVHQASAYIERELAPDVGVRTGMVLNAKRQPYGTINVSRPLECVLGARRYRRPRSRRATRVSR